MPRGNKKDRAQASGKQNTKIGPRNPRAKQHPQQHQQHQKASPVFSRPKGHQNSRDRSRRDMQQRHPLPPRPVRGDDALQSRPGGHDVYRFGESYKPSYSQSSSRNSREHRDHSQFTFQSDFAAPSFQARTISDHHRPDRQRRYNNQPGGHQRFGNARGGRRYNPPAHDRAILSLNNRERTPERLTGMIDGHVHFDLSANVGETSDEDERNSKRRKVSGIDDANRPQWSNPDPYTALPPTFEPRPRKLDVVQLIRQAKVVHEKSAQSENALAENADYVSLDFGPSVDVKKDYDLSQRTVLNSNDSSKSTNRNRLPDRQPTQSQITQSGSSKMSQQALPAPVHFDLSNRDNPNRRQAPQRVVIDLTGPDNDSSHRPSQRRAFIDLSGPAPELSRSYLPQTSGKKRKMFTKGSIVPHWASEDASSAAPWSQGRDYSTEQSVSWRLHEEIVDFHQWARPRPYEQDMRDALHERIDSVVRRTFPDCRLKAFGSYASGLYLPTADMDLVMVTSDHVHSARYEKPYDFRRRLNKIHAGIQKAGFVQYRSDTKVFMARVPIIKFTDNNTGLKVDISYNNLTGVFAIQTFKDWQAQYPELEPLVYIIKQFLQMRDLNEVFSGGLGGFSITCLIVSFLELQCGRETDASTVANSNLAWRLIGFFEFYGKKFDRRAHAIRLNPHEYFEKPLYNPPRGDGGTSHAALIADVFAKAADTLRHTMSLLQSDALNSSKRNNSILGCILGGNYASFTQQRNQMYELAQRYQR